MKPLEDLTGRPFGMLVVLSPSWRAESETWCRCRCKCGKECDARVRFLLDETKRSCGCLRVLAGQTTQRKHGMHRTPEYRTWIAIRSRCLTPTDCNYPRYGGAGVTICPEWVESFESFYAAVGPRPSSEHSIDRYPNQAGNYEPGNVRWATLVEQNNNKRTNRLFTRDGRTQSIARWAAEYGMTRGTLRNRLERGMSIEQALAAPVTKGPHANA